MTIQPISAVSAALYFTSADLQECGVRIDRLTAERTLELTKDAFRQAGLPLDSVLELETYPDKCGLLVFVHMAPARQTVWRFDDCEALLAAVNSLGPEGADGSLYWWEGHWWLVLPGQENDTSARMAEFGSEKTDAPYILARLAEYGALLLPSHAPSTLRNHFSL